MLPLLGPTLSDLELDSDFYKLLYLRGFGETESKLVFLGLIILNVFYVLLSFVTDTGDPWRDGFFEGVFLRS